MPKKPPKKSERTKERILDVAQSVFSSKGYGEAGLREIAKAANVDVAMVSRYFGSKEGLFAAVLDESLNTRDWEMPRADFGRRVAAMFADDAADAISPLRILTRAAGNSGAKDKALEVLQAQIVEPLAKWLGEPNGVARACEILAICGGIFTYRIMLPLGPFTGAFDPSARRWIERVLQDIVDGKDQEHLASVTTESL